MPADQIPILASGAQTASGESAWMPIPDAEMLMVGIDITAGTAITRFDAWIVVSPDGGLTEYECPADLVLQTSSVSSPTGAGLTTSANLRNIITNKSTTTAERFLAIYKQMPGDRFKVRWALNGTSITFSASAVAK